MTLRVKVEKRLELTKGAVKTRWMYNASGAAMSIGDIVVSNPTGTDAPGYECTTTTAQDDRDVVGMVYQAMAAGGWGLIQYWGYTQLLKVNGTTDIAKGDDLSTYTVAGIAGKATAGAGGIFAEAWEAYAANDSAGVINAFIDVSRQPNATSATAPAIGLVGEMAAFPLAAANVIGTTAKYSPPDHVHLAAITDDIDFLLGASSDVALQFDTAETADAFKIGLDAVSHTLHIMDKADMGTNTTLAAQSDPTMVLWDSTLTDYLLTTVDTAGPTFKIIASDSYAFEIGGTEYLDLSASGLKLTQTSPLLDANGNELWKFTATASAVNELTLANAATGTAPIISASGETNVGITLQPAGTGTVLVDTNGNGVALTIDAESTTVNVLDIVTPMTTTANVIDVGDANSLTTGSIANFASASTSGGTRNLVSIANTGAGSTAARLLFLNQDIDAITAIIDAESTTADVLQFLAPATISGNIISITAANGLTTGSAFIVSSATGLTTGALASLQLGDANVITSGEALAIRLASTAITAAKTGSLASIVTARTLTGTGLTDNYDALSLARTSTANSDTQTFTVQGSVLKLANTTVATLGTLTDSSHVLEIVQTNTSGTMSGDALNIIHAGTGSAIDINSAATTSHAITFSGMSQTTGHLFNVNSADALSTGSILYLISNSADIGTRSLVYIENVNDLATGATVLTLKQTLGSNKEALVVDYDSTGGRAVLCDMEITTGLGFQLKSDTVTTGTVFDIDDAGATALTTGTLANIDCAGAAITSGEALKVNHTISSATLANKSGNLISFTASRTSSRASGTTADDYDVLTIARTNIQSIAGGTLTATGSLLRLVLVSTQQDGTLTDSTSLLGLTGNTTSTGSHVITGGTNEDLKIAPNGTGVIRVNNAASWVANGTGTVTVSNLAPTGTTATIGAWFHVKDSSGNRYLIAARAYTG